MLGLYIRIFAFCMRSFSTEEDSRLGSSLGMKKKRKDEL
jgi:hypothetical protein